MLRDAHSEPIHKMIWRLQLLGILLLLGSSATAGGGRRTLQATSRPEIRITSWPDTNATAYGLASLLLDPNTVVLVNASYSGDRQAAGYANFSQENLKGWYELYGPYQPADGITHWGLQPPHHFFIGWSGEGAMMATARIDGAPLTSSLTKVTSLASGAPTGAIRAVKLTMYVRAKYDGNLRVRWNFGDAAHPTAKATVNAYASSNNTIRIKVDGESTILSGCATIFAPSPSIYRGHAIESHTHAHTHTIHRRAPGAHSPEPLCVHRHIVQAGELFQQHLFGQCRRRASLLGSAWI
jgi:hypothetical protein